MLYSRRKLLIAAALALLIVPVLSACGPTKANISMTTYSITMDKDSLPAGQAIFHVTNDATDQKHSMHIVKTDLAEDKLPLDANNNVDLSKLTVISEVQAIQPGESQDINLNLTPGNYVLICNLPGHYNQGMHVAFTVK